MHRKKSKPTRIDTLPTSQRRPTIGKLLQQVMGTVDGAGEGGGAGDFHPLHKPSTKTSLHLLMLVLVARSFPVAGARPCL